MEKQGIRADWEKDAVIAMENVRRKNKMIETYSILIIDLLCVFVSYALSVYIRFHIIHVERYPKEFHITVGAYIVVLCLLYSLFLDANSNFFTEGGCVSCIIQCAIH